MAFPESDFVQKLVTDPCNVPKLVVLTGFYKEHPPPGGAAKPKCRVYLNHALTDYYEFETTDHIKHVEQVADDDRQRVWIVHGSPARLVRSRAVTAEPPPLLEGPITRALLPQAGAPGPWPGGVVYGGAPQYGQVPQVGVDWSPLEDGGFEVPTKCARGCFSYSP